MKIEDIFREIRNLRKYKGLTGIVEDKDFVVTDTDGNRLRIVGIRTSNDGLFIEVDTEERVEPEKKTLFFSVVGA